MRGRIVYPQLENQGGRSRKLLCFHTLDLKIEIRHARPLGGWWLAPSMPQRSFLSLATPRCRPTALSSLRESSQPIRSTYRWAECNTRPPKLLARTPRGSPAILQHQIPCAEVLDWRSRCHSRFQVSTVTRLAPPGWGKLRSRARPVCS